jgi:hypothetical protein
MLFSNLGLSTPISMNGLAVLVIGLLGTMANQPLSLRTVLADTTISGILTQRNAKRNSNKNPHINSVYIPNSPSNLRQGRL